MTILDISKLKPDLINSTNVENKFEVHKKRLEVLMKQK